MPDIWNTIKNTTESLGHAAYAPAGVVVDLAQMPFDDKDDDFGSVIHALSVRAGDVADPVFNPQTITGSALGSTLAAMNWAWIEGVSRPVATANMTYRHTFGGLGNFGPLGALASLASGRSNIGDLFDAQTWNEAYKRAQQQDNPLGAAFAFGALKPTSDPLAFEDPYKTVTGERGALASGLAWTGEIAGTFAGDPAYLGLKGLGALRMTSLDIPGLATYSRLSASDRAALLNKLTETSRPGVMREGLAARTDKYLDWIGGENKLGRPLLGPEILHGTPELKRYAAEPEVIAGLLADANKIGDVVGRRDAQRRILAVAAGDVGQIARLRTEVTESASIADALANMARDGVVDLKALAAQPMLRTDPMFIHRLDQQIKNLNDSGDIDRFMADWNGRLDQLVETKHTLTHLPGVHTAGARAVSRENEAGLLRSGANARRSLDDWASRRALEAEGASSVFQRGLYTVPIVAVRTLGLAASPWTKAPVAVADALRQTHFTGLANVHDWGSATTQLDSMMRLAGATPADRMKILSEAYVAKGEPEKLRAINLAEEASLQALARKYSARGQQEIHPAYIKELLAAHASKRDQSRAMLQGRAYAATEQSPELLTRAGSAQRAEDAAALSESTGATPTPQGTWRVDQINDDGTPLALPLLETQLANVVPLLDIDIARTLLKRDSGYLARLSRAWQEDSLALGKMAEQKRLGHVGLERAMAARAASVDWLVNAGQVFMRGWKFSVLFRLGYPMRVLMDDHFRIWSQMHAATFYGENGGELIANWRYNRFTRRDAAREQIHALKVRRQEILDELDGDRMVVHLDRQNELRSVQASLRSQQRSAANLRTQVEEAETKHSLGMDVPDLPALRDKLAAAERNVVEREGAQAYLLEQLGEYGPEDLTRELESIESLIASGWKGLADPKRSIGSGDVELGDGASVQGAFAGEFGSLMRSVASSSDSFDNQIRGVEDRMYRAAAGGAHRTIDPKEPGHLHAWADVLNNQIRTSPVAMHFVNGGTVPEFVRWVRKPEQADLRRRLAHFAHDPEDWGQRVQGLVWDYLPTDAVREAVVAGRVSPNRLGKMFADPSIRPAVHGRAVADNLGTSAATLGIGRAVNRIYRMLGELPTDRLSRHPYFNSLYRAHAKDIYAVRRAGEGPGGRFTQADLDEISRQARRRALADLKRTLFDISAHSHAAHVMRFVSPFFAAHQEGVARWWRIAADRPQVLRRYTQAFEVPRYLGLEVDENGDLVKPGAPISRNHRILLQLPQAFGGDDPTVKQSSWTVSETSFNIILQGGLSNPGVGPVVSIPMEWAVEKYADDPTVARVARVFSPFPPNSPMEGALAATMKRLSAWTYGETGFDPSLGLGVGKREYNAAFAQHVQDLTVDFHLKHGREPNSVEASDIVERAGREATTQMFHRFLWNVGSPAPATPRSKYAVIQQGWYKIAAQAQVGGRDFDWAYAQFKDRYGEAYMPLVYSTSNNPAWVDADPASVSALKHYEGVLKKVDPALTRMVIGAYADDMIEKDATLGEFSSDARNWLRDQQIKPGSSETYYSQDEPADALREQMARRGWQKYGELTAGLTAQAQAMGLDSYMESTQLLAIKRAGVQAIRDENFAFDQDYGTFDSTQYDRYLADMRTIVSSPILADDPERTDIQTLGLYLKLRDFFGQVFTYRQAQGLGGYEAQAQDQVRQIYTALVGRLVESNTFFESHMFNGGVERDPWLLDASTTTGTPGA